MPTSAERIESHSHLTLARPLYDPASLRPLLEPRSVAVIGASEREGSFGGQVLLNLLAAPGVDVYAVNPRAERVHGVTCYPTLDDVPVVVDLVAICVPSKAVVGVAEAALQNGVPAAIIYSSGFAELRDGSGDELQVSLRDIAARGLRIMGPNCLGLVNSRAGIEMQFVPGFGDDLVPGEIGIVTQSGGLGLSLLQGQFDGLAGSFWAGPGNSCDVDPLDLAAYMLDDEDTRVVVLAIEKTLERERLLELGRLARVARKPVLIHKMARHEYGARFAGAHTGSDAGMLDQFERDVRDAGMVLIEHFDDLKPAADFIARMPLETTGGVGILSGSGGAAILAADEAEAHGVALPSMSESSAARLRGLLPPFATVDNPSDLTSEATRSLEMFELCLDVFEGEPSFDAVFVVFSAVTGQPTVDRAALLVERSRRDGPRKPLGVLWLSEWTSNEAYRTLQGSRDIAVFRSFRAAMVAVRAWTDAREALGSAS